MRILDVSPRLVWPPETGSTSRMYHLLRELSRSHEVRQFSQPLLTQLRSAGFSTDVWPTGSYREHRTPSLISALASQWCERSWIRPQAIFSGACLRLVRPPLLRDWLGWADLALVEFPWQFAYCRRMAPELPMVLVSHNVEVLTRTSNARAAGVAVGRSPMLRLVRRLEQQAVTNADLIVTVSEDDRREHIRRYGVDAETVVTVPNGADTESLVPLDLEAKRALRARLGLPDRPTLVYLAAVPKVPDVEGLKWVRRLARREPDLSFLVVGGIAARACVEDNLIVTGLVRDHRPYVQAADISLNPIVHGGGTKLKVLDGLAAGLATVVFAETIRGTALRDGEHVIVAEKSDAALAGAVRSILKEPGFANTLASAGRRFVCERHDWRSIAPGLERALVALLGRAETY